MGNTAMEKAMEKEGLVSGDGNRYPFLSFKQDGGFVVGIIEAGREVTFIPKKGKNKGKKQETTYFPIKVTDTNLKGVEKGQYYTISPTGLLLYQLTKGKPASVSFPSVVGINYLGKDDEDRHQTEVRWPKAAK